MYKRIGMVCCLYGLLILRNMKKRKKHSNVCSFSQIQVTETNRDIFQFNYLLHNRSFHLGIFSFIRRLLVLFSLEEIAIHHWCHRTSDALNGKKITVERKMEKATEIKNSTSTILKNEQIPLDLHFIAVRYCHLPQKLNFDNLDFNREN